MLEVDALVTLDIRQQWRRIHQASRRGKKDFLKSLKAVKSRISSCSNYNPVSSNGIKMKGMDSSQ